MNMIINLIDVERMKRWDAEITADVLTNILQPGRFAQLDTNLTVRNKERQLRGAPCQHHRR